MDYDALSASERRKYHAAVSGTHHRRVELVILTLDDKVVRSLPNRFLGGSIGGDTSRTPAEVMEALVFDDDHLLDWHHGQHKKFKARIIDSRFVPALDDWVDAVAFTGPLRSFTRTGPTVSLAAQGSERLAMGSVRRAFHRPRKARATAVIRDLLKAAGAPDRGLRIPRLKARLPEAVTVGVKRGQRRDENGDKAGKGKDSRRTVQIMRVTREDTYWGKAAPIARALDRDLYADNRGRFVMAPPPGKPTAKLTNRLLTAPPTVKGGGDSDSEATNTWILLGANPKGPKKQVRAEVGLPKKHPLSAQSLAWHNSPYEVTATVENKHWRRKAQAIRAGLRLRDRAVSESVAYEVEALPILPWIRPGALFTVSTPGGSARVRARQWTLPLGPDASPMVIGANRRSGWR